MLLNSIFVCVVQLATQTSVVFYKQKPKKIMKYKQIVEQIRNLSWGNISGLELQWLMILSGFAAREFAESLRIALDLHPGSPELREMAAGELKTTNLQFAGYNAVGDHADFIWNFIKKAGIDKSCPAEVIAAGERYLEEVKKISPAARAMSIVSREKELSGIFAEILKAKDWSAEGLGAFRYYLERHIALDSEEGGHADLLSGFEVNDVVAEFYQARLDLYRCIPKLFENK